MTRRGFAPVNQRIRYRRLIAAGGDNHLINGGLRSVAVDSGTGAGAAVLWRRRVTLTKTASDRQTDASRSYVYPPSTSRQPRPTTATLADCRYNGGQIGKGRKKGFYFHFMCLLSEFVLLSYVEMCPRFSNFNYVNCTVLCDWFAFK